MKNRIYGFIIELLTIVDGVFGIFLCWFNKYSSITMKYIAWYAKKHYKMRY